MRKGDRSRLKWADLVGEAVAGVVQRPVRSMLTTLGTVLGAGAFVAILGLTATSAGQISQRFTEIAATEVTISAGGERSPGERELTPDHGFPVRADDTVQRLNGVVAAGRHWQVPLDEDTMISARAQAHGRDRVLLDVFAASPGALRAANTVPAGGVLFDSFHERHGAKVALLGAGAASRLGISRLDSQPAVYIGDEAYTVIGIIENAERLPHLGLGVTIPASTALTRYSSPLDPIQMLVETRIGAAELVARQAPTALRPDNPKLLTATAPPDPATLRDGVAADVNGLFILLAGLALVIGAFGIANTTMVAVMERANEIGLRRALGARKRHIATQFIAESALLGVLGGLIGASLGVVTVVLVAYTKQWTALLDPLAVLPAPIVGGAIGILAGLYPALRAASIEPVDALQS
ncbi:putative ABC transport system permease protein [Amycolatopsis marina]|uniref:Putative ABC transport system permease protein n=1 Tax=Amycolatopsis marina TaxID=490629 RepID=A0A1I1AXF5_9PSEU|nr:ABC transporter permease [Amycolatopsis marina]SFB42764.1 putative ABC transport system permease protein [Amycolatopsis marina]